MTRASFVGRSNLFVRFIVFNDVSMSSKANKRESKCVRVSEGPLHVLIDLF